MLRPAQNQGFVSGYQATYFFTTIPVTPTKQAHNCRIHPIPLRGRREFVWVGGGMHEFAWLNLDVAWSLLRSPFG